MKKKVYTEQLYTAEESLSTGGSSSTDETLMVTGMRNANTPLKLNPSV